MQQLASDHQSQLYEVAKNTESLEDEVKLLTLAKDHQHDEFKTQDIDFTIRGQPRSDNKGSQLNQTEFVHIGGDCSDSRGENCKPRGTAQEARDSSWRVYRDDASFELCVSYHAM
ncbi:hypothetical protein CPC16_004031 [Podila verticillata]|nr:hypothetical protein CPC16_004031 [Podila verticillata]